ncbi:MAG: lipid-A-disaccharide synthase N-terminal domain-containing protein [Candidatus Omnitrophica bacterium]|nr:lipid-A-disaccharide synthase N-terminal domain-containing protein [Candidatus Omnitrophota bacterium]
MNATIWLVIGFAGQLLFALRFLVQWICSEVKQESHIPVVFWYFSISGGAILLTYAIHKQDPVFIVGQATGLVVYLRNLMLIYKKEQKAKAER